MGKGDKRSKKGKIFSGSHGNTRPRKKQTAPPESKPANPTKKKKK